MEYVIVCFYGFTRNNFIIAGLDRQSQLVSMVNSKEGWDPLDLEWQLKEIRTSLLGH
jgi:hypothetical protein